MLAENLVADMASRDRLPVVIVNPSTPIGPRDVRPTPTGRIIVEAAAGRMPAFVDTGLNFAHVDDVAAGHLAALRQGRIGERYILGGENVALRDMLAEIAARRRPPAAAAFGCRASAVYPIAFGAELYARITKREPFVTLDGLRMSRYRMFFDDSKARRELGYTSRPYREGLVDAIAWFAQAGYLPRAIDKARLACSRVSSGSRKRTQTQGMNRSPSSASIETQSALEIGVAAERYAGAAGGGNDRSGEVSAASSSA